MSDTLLPKLAPMQMLHLPTKMYIEKGTNQKESLENNTHTHTHTHVLHQNWTRYSRTYQPLCIQYLTRLPTMGIITFLSKRTNEFAELNP
jgi:hypothetical protein